MRTVSLLCLLACSSLAVLQHAAAVDSYERWEVESRPVAQLIDIMGRVEVDQDQIDLMKDRVMKGDPDVKEAIIKLIVGDAKPKSVSPQHARELGGMNLGGLRKRALKAGVPEEEAENALDEADAKRALINLIIAAEPQETGYGMGDSSESYTAKLEELSKAKFTALRTRAVAAGLDPTVLEELLDYDDPKSALAEYILALEGGGPPPVKKKAPPPPPPPAVPKSRGENSKPLRKSSVTGTTAMVGDMDFEELETVGRDKMESNKLHEASYFFLQAISLDPGRKNPGYKRVEALWRETGHKALKGMKKLGSPKLMPGGSGLIKNGKTTVEEGITDLGRKGRKQDL